MSKEITPANDVEKLVLIVHEHAKQLDLNGLTLKQKMFVLSYAGCKTTAAQKAGYKGESRNSFRQAAMGAMSNEQVAKNIKILDKMLERVCCANAVEIKLILSERIRSKDCTDGHRAQFAKILLQAHGELTEKLIIESKQTKTTEHVFTFNMPMPNLLKAPDDNSIIDVEPEPSDDEVPLW